MVTLKNLNSYPQRVHFGSQISFKEYTDGKKLIKVKDSLWFGINSSILTHKGSILLPPYQIKSFDMSRSIYIKNL